MDLVEPFRRIMSSDLQDIYVGGYLERKSSAEGGLFGGRMLRFAPLWDQVYLGFEVGLIRLSVIEQGGGILLTEEACIEPREEYDDGDGLAFSRMIWPLLGVEGPAKLRACEMWEPLADGTVVKAIGFDFSRGRYLFFDPMNIDGIAPGSERERDLWASEYPSQRVEKILL